MKKILSLFAFIAASVSAVMAQNPGDTIFVPTIDYSYASRSAYVEFPDVPVEKILMLYNMRCKNGLVSSGQTGQTNIGCGEWDYTCNTYITDSSLVDSTKATHPSHIITGFSGNSYNYSNNPTYTYYRFTQQNVNVTGTTSESVHTVGTGSSTSTAPFGTAKRTSKSQFLWKASELTTAGLTAGSITSIKLNVTTLGSSAQFLKVRMKPTTAIALDNANPDMTGFTEVYFLSTALINGTNDLHFYTPFNWNGTDNIIVEFSFTNSTTGTNNVVAADITANVSGLITSVDDYAYKFTGSNMMSLSGNFTPDFSNQVSIGFWCYGDPGINGNSIVYATNSQGQRLANVHMPWDLQVYWDCGVGGSYDRINQAAPANVYSGKWNYWVFTKNSTTGVMKSYLNGVQWQTGSNKNLGVMIDQLLLGSMPGNQNSFRGKFDDFTLWNSELSAATVSAWMNRVVTTSHPNYSNLKAFYNFNNQGGAITDVNIPTNTGTITGNGTPQWSLINGKDIFKGFTETMTRPTVSFVKGVYTQTIAPIVVIDSIVNSANTVYSYAVSGTNIVQTNMQNYFLAGYSYVYDGDSGNLVDSVNNPSDGSITITQLNYFLKNPSSFQLVSFVTPYGINLDMGMNGKTWTFDVTDFAPILKGWKRVFMNGGGEYQEQMDIKFAFIVGTPPREVKEIKNIWPVESVGYTNLLNDNKMEPRSLKLDATANAFKVRTAITGHGQEGEFIPRTHYLNVNGGPAEFSWEVWKECASNPVYPQGGTWIYDRAGWCPGMATDVRESVLAAAPGDSISLDYGLNTASGASNYWVSNQLITYGAPNFSLDATISQVKNPSNRVEYARTNPVCNKPVVTLQNTGSTTLTSATIEYWVNNNTQKQIYQWTGSLPFLSSEDVSLPAPDGVWNSVTMAGPNIFHAKVKSPNGGADQYALNDQYNSSFAIPEVLPASFVLYIKTNNKPNETKYWVKGADGTVYLDRSSGLAPTTVYSDTLNLPLGCFTIEITDSDDDGLSFWVNDGETDGIARVQNINGQVVKNFQTEFGRSLIYNFTTNSGLNIDQNKENNRVKVYPNPTKGFFTIEGKNLEGSLVTVYNALGQTIEIPFVQKGTNIIQLDATALSNGVYSLQLITKAGGRQTLKLTKVD